MTSKRNLDLSMVAVLSHTISSRGVTLCVIAHNLLFLWLLLFVIFVKNLLLNVCTDFVCSHRRSVPTTSTPICISVRPHACRMLHSPHTRLFLSPD